MHEYIVVLSQLARCGLIRRQCVLMLCVAGWCGCGLLELEIMQCRLFGYLLAELPACI